MSLQMLLGAAGGVGFGASLCLLVATLAGWQARMPRRHPRHRVEPATIRRLGAAAAAGLVVALLTRWPVAAAAVFTAVAGWPLFFGGAAAGRAKIEQLDGLATWTESLRDTIAGAVGLEQAIPATVDAAPPVVQPQLRRLAGALTARVPLPRALTGFAEDIDDPTADLVVAALVLNARLRGPGLADTLSALSTSTREELDMRRRIEAGRASLRRQVQIIVAATAAFTAFLAVFSRDYVAVYGTVAGQLMLLVVVGIYAGGFFWLRRLADAATPARFLADADTVAAATTPGEETRP